MAHMNSATNWDCIVVGGGPAGTTAATMLAKRGRRVLLFDKAKHPRYHIGESLIPFCYYTLERLGLAERMQRSGWTKKYSVQFVGTSGADTRPFYFFEHLFDASAVCWQVWRADFDLMLLNHSRDCGVTIEQEAKVERFLLDAKGAVCGVLVRDAAGVEREVHAPVCIDASGRDALSASQFGWRMLDKDLARFAIWSYFTDTVRDPGIDAGATTVASVPEGGWFWYIPLPDQVVSVGVVSRRDYLFREHPGEAARDPQALEEIFKREVRTNRWVERHLAPARRVQDFRLTNEYSYRSQHCSRDGLVLAGDALSFLDPIFSSGVFLALRMGELAATAVDGALSANDTSAERFADYGARVSSGVQAMRQLVYAFYSPRFSFGQLIKKDPGSRSDIADLLCGNFFRDYAPFYRQVAEFADLPQGSFTSTPWRPRHPEAQPAGAKP